MVEFFLGQSSRFLPSPTPKTFAPPYTSPYLAQNLLSDQVIGTSTLVKRGTPKTP